MAFPASPSNNQVHKEGNRSFVYDSTLGVWDQVKEIDRSSLLPSSLSHPSVVPLSTPKVTTDQIILTPGNAPNVTEGAMYYNSTTNVVYVYDGAAWQAMDIYGADTYPIKYTIVAGGGGGGRGSTSYAGGGGGAGGAIQGTFFATEGVAYTITIGAGGSSSAADTSYSGNGGSSSITGTGLVQLEAIGGSKGSNTTAAGDVHGGNSGGGCGGGAGAGSGISVSNIQGFMGGAAGGTQGCGGGNAMNYSGTNFNGGGGGGGARTAGGTPNTGNGPVGGGAAGGKGIRSIITGTDYGGGGGGGYGSYGASNGGAGGVGGGGQGGGGSGSRTAVAGSANTGGGGGGGSGNAGTVNGGTGGSGIIILSLPTTRSTGTFGATNPSSTTSGTNTILTYTASGSYTA